MITLSKKSRDLDYYFGIFWMILCSTTHMQSFIARAKLVFFFFIWVFYHNHSWITGLQGKRESISLAPHYHFHPLYRHLDISRAITAESSPLHIASSRTRTGNLWFPSASRQPLSYAPSKLCYMYTNFFIIYSWVAVLSFYCF